MCSSNICRTLTLKGNSGNSQNANQVLYFTTSTYKMAQLKSEKKEPRKILADLHMGNKNIFFLFLFAHIRLKRKI